MKEPIDGIPLAVGLASLLRQFHASRMHGFLEYYGQYIRTALDAQRSAHSATAPRGHIIVNEVARQRDGRQATSHGDV